MRVKLQKWGNSPAVRVPANTIRELGAHYGDELEVDIKYVIREPRAGWAEALTQHPAEATTLPDVLDDDRLEDWVW